MTDILVPPGVVPPLIIDPSNNRIYFLDPNGVISAVIATTATSHGIAIANLQPTTQCELNWDQTVGGQLIIQDTGNSDAAFWVTAKGRVLDMYMTRLPTVNPGVEVGRLYANAGTISYVQTAGTQQVETSAIAYTVPGVVAAGNMTVTITAAGMTGSPRTVTVAVATNDPEATLAANIVTAINSDVDVGGGLNWQLGVPFATAAVTGGTSVKITKMYAAANDATMNLAINDPNVLGITAVVTSTHTTAGAAPT